MAASTMPKTGSKYGPCASECQHTDCAATRTMAAQACGRAQRPALRVARLDWGPARLPLTGPGVACGTCRRQTLV